LFVGKKYQFLGQKKVEKIRTKGSVGQKNKETILTTNSSINFNYA